VKRISNFLIVAVLIAAMVGCGDGAIAVPVEYHLTIASTAEGLVTTPGEGTFTYDESEVVNLLAEAEDGYQFINWTGDVGSIANVNAASTTIIMDGDYSITANFETYELGEYSIIYIPSTIKVMMDDDSVEIMDLDEYVKGVVAAEMGSDWPIEALKAQAVAARTFAVSNTHHDHCNVDVCTDHNCCQAWKCPPYDLTIVDAVTSTCNEVITYNGTIIREALYFSHCDGHTRNSEDYDGWDYVPYLRGVSCGCADAYGWTDHNSHGVGMCQYGARVMAEQDFSYVDILKHYYSGVEIATAHTGQIVVKLCSPAELRVYDTQERVTGLVDGDAKNEIPYSDYHDHTVTISLPSGSYKYEIAGLEEGTYGLDIASIEDDEAINFIATDIPVAPGAVHHYTVDWDVLAGEEEGVMVQVDEKGDDTVDYTLTAGSSLHGNEFVPSTQYDLSISSTAGGSVTTPTEGTFMYADGTVVSLAATPATGYQFINWTGDVGTIADINAASTTITINDSYSIMATFEAITAVQYRLTISSTAGGSVTMPGGGAFACDVGMMVILVATPASGYQFVNWTGDVGTIANVNAAITTITMNNDYSITANFEEIPEYDLLIASTAGGSVTLPGENEGTVVSLVATPVTGYQFDNWIGNVGTIANVNAASTTVTVNNNYSIQAIFSEAPSSPPGISYTEAEAEALIIVLVNAERQQFGLPALSEDSLLTSLAREHSISMVVNNFFSHDRYPGERSFSYGQPPGTIRGENIAMIPTRQVIPGPYLSLQEVCEWAVSAWMSSSGHRENILEPCYTKTGVGVAFSEGAEYLYITQMFEGAY